MKQLMIAVALVMSMSVGTQVHAAPAPDADDSWPGMKDETIGGLAQLAPATAAIKLAGEPIKKTKAQYQGATGDYVATWTFHDGITLEVAQDKPGKPFHVTTIQVGAASKWKTKAGIGIGSTLAEVRAAYGAYLHAPEADQAGGAWIVGDVYGGLFLTVEHDHVTAMYLGAMAF